MELHSLLDVAGTLDDVHQGLATAVVEWIEHASSSATAPSIKATAPDAEDPASLEPDPLDERSDVSRQTGVKAGHEGPRVHGCLGTTDRN